MKKWMPLCILIIMFSCRNDEPKPYVSLSGKIDNAHSSNTLKITKGKDFEKIINLEEDGTFNDTLKVTEGDYTLQHGEQYGSIYLKNNNVTTFHTDYENFDEKMSYGGDGANINNFSLQAYLLSRDHFTEELISNGTEQDLNMAIEDYRTAYLNLKTQYPKVDSTHVALMDKTIDRSATQLKDYVMGKIALRTELPEGSPSPEFLNYKNVSGGTTSLSDLRGKYVYMDIWATWCGPCIMEIPALKDIESQFKDQNIEFVSISVDEGRGYSGDKVKAEKGWKKMVSEKELGGIQLLADNGFRSQFIQDYKIRGIPRFILVDPEGYIVNPDAPRPSNPKLVELFGNLGLSAQ